MQLEIFTGELIATLKPIFQAERTDYSIVKCTRWRFKKLREVNKINFFYFFFKFQEKESKHKISFSEVVILYICS